MKQILKWALGGCLAFAGFDLLLGFAAMLGVIDSVYYQIANLPALMIYPGGPGSAKASLPIWVPQMAAIGFVGGAALGSIVALTKRSSERSASEKNDRGE